MCKVALTSDSDLWGKKLGIIWGGVGVCILEFLGGLETQIETVTHESTVVDVACRVCLSERIFRLLIL